MQPTFSTVPYRRLEFGQRRLSKLSTEARFRPGFIPSRYASLTTGDFYTSQIPAAKPSGDFRYLMGVR
jgi:hypothetical protein